MTTQKKKTEPKTDEPLTLVAYLDQIDTPDPLPATLGERKALLLAAMPTLVREHEAKVDTKKGGSYSFKFITHDQVALVSRKMLPKFGIDYHASSHISEVGGRVFVVLAVTLAGVGLNPSDESETSEWYLPLPTGVTPQEMGAVYSYLTKYGLQKSLLMDAGNEDLDEGQFAGAGGGLPKRRREGSAPPADYAQPSLQKEPHTLAFGIPEGVWAKLAGLWHDKGNISEPQRKRIFAIAGQNGWKGDEVSEVVSFHLGVKLEQIPFGKPYDGIVATFEKFGPTRDATEQLDGIADQPDDDGGSDGEFDFGDGGYDG